MPGLRLGIHLSVARGLEETLARTRRLRLETLQIFSANPRSFRARPLDPARAAAFRAGLEAAGVAPLVVHAPYPLNPASPEEEVWRASLELMLREMERCALLGARFLVFHPGSHRGAGVEAGLRRAAEAVRLCLRDTPAGVGLAVENTAGSGQSLGGPIRDLARLLELAGDPARLTVWLDSAHAFAAGYDLSRPSGVDGWLAEVESLIGLKRLAGLHVNDSATGRGSLSDRHQHLGRGRIGAPGLSWLLAHPSLEGLPGILETPRESEADEKRDLAQARRLRSLGLKQRPSQSRSGCKSGPSSARTGPAGC